MPPLHPRPMCPQPDRALQIALAGARGRRVCSEVHVVTIMSNPLFLALLIYASMLWSPCSPYYMYGAEKRQQGKLIWMSRELMTDAEMKVKAVQYYRDQYYKAIQFQLGDLMYDLRDSYKKMVRLYQGMEKNISYGYLNHYENIKIMILVIRMNVEIENKVNMVQKWQNKRNTKEQHYVRMQAVLRSGTNHEYDELEDAPLWEEQVRERLARGVAAGAPPPRAPPLRARTRSPALDLAGQRKNKKWRHVRDDDFARRST